MTELLLSFRLAFLVTVILLVCATPLAYWLAFSRWRAKFFVEAVVALPLVLPPTVLGFYVLIAIGRFGLAFTFRGLVIASILYSLPFAVQPIAAAFSAVERKYIEASWMLGMSNFQTFFRVIVPQSWAGVVTGFVLSFAHTLGEFGVVLMVGGNIEGETRTVSIDIYDEVQALNYAGAAKTALFLLAISYSVLLAVYAMNRRVWALWPQK